MPSTSVWFGKRAGGWCRELPAWAEVFEGNLAAHVRHDVAGGLKSDAREALGLQLLPLGLADARALRGRYLREATVFAPSLDPFADA